MKRWLVVGLTIVVVTVFGLGAWGYFHERGTVADARARLAAAQESIRHLSSRLRAEAHEAARLERARRRLNGSVRSARHELQIALQAPDVADVTRRSVSGRHEGFAPKGARIAKLRVIPPGNGDPPLVAVAWKLGSIAPDRPMDTGVVVWQGPRDVLPSGTWERETLRWRSAFQIDVPLFRYLHAFIGPPWRSRAVRSYGDLGVNFEAGDATGDGRPDILIEDASSGSGGCAIYRLLSDSGSGLRQIFWRDHCEGPIGPAHGMLKIVGAVWPNGCRLAHGCGRSRTLLRWNGNGWSVFRREVQIYRAELG